MDSQNPWLGLVSFTEALRDYFHGRNKEADELFRRVKREVLTVLFGQSGLGKTSLLQAGLFPRLRREGFLPVAIRLGFDPQAPGLSLQVKEAVAGALKKAELAEAPLPTPEETLWEYFHRLDVPWKDRDGKRISLVLVFDQFEELFTRGQGREGRKFPDRAVAHRASGPGREPCARPSWNSGWRKTRSWSRTLCSTGRTTGSCSACARTTCRTWRACGNDAGDLA